MEYNESLMNTRKYATVSKYSITKTTDDHTKHYKVEELIEMHEITDKKDGELIRDGIIEEETSETVEELPEMHEITKQEDDGIIEEETSETVDELPETHEITKQEDGGIIEEETSEKGRVRITVIKFMWYILSSLGLAVNK